MYRTKNYLQLNNIGRGSGPAKILIFNNKLNGLAVGGHNRNRKIEDEKMWKKKIDELKIRNLGIGSVRAEIGL